MFRGRNHNPTYQQEYFGEMHFHIVKIVGESVFASNLWDVREVIDSFGVVKGANLLDGKELVGPEKSKMIDSGLELELIDGYFFNDGVLGAWVMQRLE